LTAVSASQIARALLASQPGQLFRLTVYGQGGSVEITIPVLKMQT
jgi:hypothetical protein